MKKRIFWGILVLIVGLGFSNTLWAEVGVTDTEIVIGNEQDLSGPIAALGVDMKKGLDMRVNEINETGGIHGRKLKLVIGDHGYDPKKAIMLTNKLINRDKVFCFVGVLGTPTSMAVKNLVTKKKIPFLFPVASGEAFYNPLDRYCFVLIPIYHTQGRIFAQYGVERKGYKRFGLLYQDDDLGTGVLKGLEQQLPKYNLKLAASEPYKRGATDFSAQIAKLRKANVDIVLLATVVRETVGALKEMKEIGWDVPVLATTAASSRHVPLLAKQAGISVDGLIFLTTTPDPTATELTQVREWRAKFTKIYGKPPSGYSGVGYDYINFLSIALERAGRDLNREKLVDALENFKAVPSLLGGPPITFSSTERLGAKDFYLAMFHGEKYWKISDWISIKE